MLVPVLALLTAVNTASSGALPPMRTCAAGSPSAELPFCDQSKTYVSYFYPLSKCFECSQSASAVG